MLAILIINFFIWCVDGLRKKKINGYNTKNGTEPDGDKSKEKGFILEPYIIIIICTVTILIVLTICFIVCLMRKKKRKKKSLISPPSVKKTMSEYECPKVAKKKSGQDNDDDDDYTNVGDFAKQQYTELTEKSGFKKYVDTEDYETPTVNPLKDVEIYKNMSSSEYQNVKRNLTQDEMYQVPTFNTTEVDQEDHYMEFNG